MRIWFPRQEPLPRNTLDFFQDILQDNGFIGKNFIIPSTPNNPKTACQTILIPLRDFFPRLRDDKKSSKREQNFPGSTSTTPNHLYTSKKFLYSL
jgi:hypothetical protein